MSDSIEPIKPDRQWTWEQWTKGRDRRRMAGKKVAPAVIRRAESKDDAHLKKEYYAGERGPAFVSDEVLLELAEQD